MNRLVTFAISMFLASWVSPMLAQVEITTSDAKSMYRNITMRHVSVHDPSIVYNPSDQYYYIFGSHRAQARTRDMQNWNSILAPWGIPNANGTVREVGNSEAFVTPQVKKVTIGGKEVDFTNFNAFIFT